MVIEPGLSPDQSQQINRVVAGPGFGEGQVEKMGITTSGPQTFCGSGIRTAVASPLVGTVRRGE